MASAFLSLGTSVAADLSLLSHELLVAGRIFGRGVVDSLNILHVIKALKKKEIRSLVWNCLFLNLFIFLGSNLLYSYALTPFFNWLTTSDSEDISNVVLWIKWIMDFFWMALWVFPVYVLSFLLNGMWYDKISEIVYKDYPRREEPAAKDTEMYGMLVDQVQKITLMWFFVLIGILWSFVPYIGLPISFVYSSWLYSLYCFEYRWAVLYPNRSPALNLESMEYYYLYYGGFGAPFAITVGLFPILIGNGVFAFLFPAFIIMAAGARPKRPEKEEQFKLLPTRVLIFKQAAWLNDRTLGFLLRMRSARKASQRKSPSLSKNQISASSTAAGGQNGVSTVHRRRSESVKRDAVSSNALASNPQNQAVVLENRDGLRISASDLDLGQFLPPGSDSQQISDLISKKSE
eukprot:TRINITY_DN15518_c0_g1_i1.p1 TRINITY_DN15518_c0_g1~~TRINITY_DN15518_c0_g1_i1.p1  ORF type:complete len:404 (-),score=49.24 TRINITY_DN15518_c0_g1_i1:130-1341(-)